MLLEIVLIIVGGLLVFSMVVVKSSVEVAVELAWLVLVLDVWVLVVELYVAVGSEVVVKWVVDVGMFVIELVEDLSPLEVVGMRVEMTLFADGGKLDVSFMTVVASAVVIGIVVVLTLMVVACSAADVELSTLV